MDRRSLIRSLFALPALATTVRDTPTPDSRSSLVRWVTQPILLPIGCDLSFCSLRWALDIGEENNLGEVKYLLIGPENKFIAREILGNYKKPFTGDSEINCLWPGFPYEVLRVPHCSFPMWTWKLVFERGVVVSEGPR